MAKFRLGLHVLTLAGSVTAFSAMSLAGGTDRGSIKDAPSAAPFSWTGFYAGINAGYAFSSSDSSANLSGDSTIVQAFINGTFDSVNMPLIHRH